MSSAATDWANKRRAQILRAEQLRAARKSGVTERGDTFQPQLSGRGSKGVTKSNYGHGGGGNREGDSLDTLAGASHKTGNAAYDDVFEVPLPGAKGARKVNEEMFNDSNEPNGTNLSPSSDTLGREMKRYGQDYDAEDPSSRYLNAHQEMARNKGSSSSSSRTMSGEGGYKSKFMKQYESPVVQQRKSARQPEGYSHRMDERGNDDDDGGYSSPSGRRGFVFNGEDLGESEQHYGGGRSDPAPAPLESSARARSKAAAAARVEAEKKAEQEAEDEFMRSLRSDTKSQGKGGKPGWNDDFDTGNSTGLFGEPKPIPKRTRGSQGVSSKVDTGLGRGKSTTTRNASGGIGGVVNVGDDMPLPTQIRKDPSAHPGFGSEYPEEYDPNQYGGGGGGGGSSRRPVPARSTSPNSGSGGPGSGQKAHARSRLSLLKNKIRMSESSGERGSRTSLKGSMERSKSDLHEHYPAAPNSGRYHFDYDGDIMANVGQGGDDDDDYYGSGGGSGYRTSKSEKAAHPGYGSSRSNRSDDNSSSPRHYDVHEVHDPQDAWSPHNGTGGARERGGSLASGGSGGGGSGRRRDGRGQRERETDASTGRRFREGQGPPSPQQYKSRYSESVFDAADHPGNADLYPGGSMGKSETMQNGGGYDSYGGDGDGGEGVYQLDALDHFNISDRDRERGGTKGNRNRQTSTNTYSSSSSASASTTKSGSGRSRDRDRDYYYGGGGVGHDIYSAAADLPGAYPEGEGPPAESYTEGYHPPNTNYGASRFDDDEEEAQHIFNGDSYEGRGQGRSRGGAQDREDENASNSYAQSKVAKRNREREREKAAARRAMQERERGWNDDSEVQQQDVDYGRGGMTERERARAKPSSRTSGANDRQRERFSERDADPYGEADRNSYPPSSSSSRRGGSSSQRTAHPPAAAPRSSKTSAYDLSNLDGAYPIEGGADGEYAPPKPQKQCPDCGRSFNLDVFSKHEKICAKVFMSKRKTFDSKKARIMGLAEQNGADAVKIAKEGLRNQRRGGGGGGGGGGGKWAEESRAFREAMRNARSVTKAIKSGAPLPPSVPNGPDMSLTPCPHCNRRFNAKAAERHIPQCQNIIAKPSRLLKNSGMGAVASAKKGGIARRGVTF